MGAKALYNDQRKLAIHQAIILQDVTLAKGIIHDRNEYRQYAKDWTPVNLDEYIAKFDIKADDYNIQSNIRKISFYSDNKEYAIVAAVGGKYFRIQEIKPDGTGGIYVGLNLKEPSISGKFQGKERRAERHRLTHFRMSYRKGTVK